MNRNTRSKRSGIYCIFILIPIIFAFSSHAEDNVCHYTSETGWSDVPFTEGSPARSSLKRACDCKDKVDELVLLGTYRLIASMEKIKFGGTTSEFKAAIQKHMDEANAEGKSKIDDARRHGAIALKAGWEQRFKDCKEQSAEKAPESAGKTKNNSSSSKPVTQ